jgi:methionine-rich copper-binding protein CopC
MKRLNRKFTTGMSVMLMALALGLAIGCDQGGGEEDEQHAEESVTYVGATDEGTPVELFIEGDTYTVKAGEDVVSRGTATKTADGTWTLQPEGGGDSFTAKAGEDSLTIEGPITDTLDGEDLHELYPVEKEPPSDVEADCRVSLSVAAIHVFPAQTEGYEKADVETLTVTVTNGGSQKTGKLTVALSGTDSESFTLSKKTITNIAVDGTTTFTVRPALDLEAGTYAAKVTVSGGNGISASFNVRFTVNKADEPEEPVDPPEEPVYGISLDVEDDYTFPDATEGYGAQEPLTVAITNIGDQETGELTVKVSNTDFTLDPAAIDNIDVADEAEFTVVPKTGLPVGTYTATVTVSGGSNIEEQSFGVSFVVTPIVVSSVSSFETLVTKLNTDKELEFASYALPGGNEGYTTAVSLTTENSPASVTIDGSGSVITGSANSITVGTGITLTLKNITFTTLPLTVSDGGSLVLETGAVVQENAGTGITVSGTLEMRAGALVTDNHDSGIRVNGAGGVFTMTSGTVSSNSSKDEDGGGGGVKVGGGEFTMEGGLITGNSAIDGGGVSVNNGAFTMSGGEISENTANGDSSYGGGVIAGGATAVFTMTGGAIHHNKGKSGGGGVVLHTNARLVLKDGEIYENEANIAAWGNNSELSFAGGGGVDIIMGGVFDMEGGKIYSNIALNGGGVSMRGTTFNMTGGEIYDNTARRNGGGVCIIDSGTFTGDPQIGGDTAPNGGGWIYDNIPTDVGSQ